VKRPQKPADGPEHLSHGHGRKSAAVREQAILALLSERTLERAAQRCGVGERTLRHWQTADTQFIADLDAARAAMFQAGMRLIQMLVGQAVNTLEDLLDASKAPAVRLDAARTVAEIGMHQHDAEIIVRKLGEIEAGGAARKLDQSAALKVIHRKDVHSTLLALSGLFLSVARGVIGRSSGRAQPWLRTRAASPGHAASASDSFCPWS
jgi:hypothetical protein